MLEIFWVREAGEKSAAVKQKIIVKEFLNGLYLEATNKKILDDLEEARKRARTRENEKDQLMEKLKSQEVKRLPNIKKEEQEKAANPITKIENEELKKEVNDLQNLVTEKDNAIKQLDEKYREALAKVGESDNQLHKLQNEEPVYKKLNEDLDYIQTSLRKLLDKIDAEESNPNANYIGSVISQDELKHLNLVVFNYRMLPLMVIALHVIFF